MKTVQNKVEEKAVKVQEATVPVELLNQTLQYLSTRPYSEVVNLISAIQETAKTS